VTPVVSHPPEPVDPFDLADALGTGPVTWSATDGLTASARVRGSLSCDDRADEEATACDLLAVDDAYPAPVTDDATRARAHQAWRHGQVHLGSCEGRLTLLVPGTGFTAELAMEAVRRLAKALGVRATDFAVLLRLGD